MIELMGISLDGGYKLYKFQQDLRMKLVLKFNEQVKLYTSALSFDHIVAFVCREFNIDPTSLHISFLDEDNDDITILSDDDIEVMQAVFEGKEYVKVNVAGELNAPLPQTEIQDIPVELVKEEQPEEIEINIQVEEIRPAEVEVEKVEEVVVEEKVAEQAKCPSEEKKEWGHHHGERMRAFEKVQSYLSETVARLVDQRVKALIPCLKEQILNHEAKKVEPIGLIHEGIECKGCLAKPIIGVRYECPTCPEFSLCELCEQKIDHDHNLLKIKKIVEKKEEDREGLGHCLKKLFRHGGHHGHHRGRSSSSSRDKCHWKGQHWQGRKCWGLSMMFGGSPEDYRAFVEQNSGLRPRQTFKKYADLQSLSEEEFRQRFIDMRCQKLSHNFGKPAQEYRAFVEENYESRYRDLVCKLEERGEKSEGRKCRWGGKRYNFNDEGSAKKEEVKPEVKEEPKKQEPKKEEPQKEEPKKEEPKKEENESALITDSLLELPKKESAEVVREKGAILTEMQEIFGRENSKEYFKLIDVHYKEGVEGVVQRWIEQSNLSKLYK